MDGLNATNAPVHFVCIDANAGRWLLASDRKKKDFVRSARGRYIGTYKLYVFKKIKLRYSNISKVGIIPIQMYALMAGDYVLV